MNVDADLCPICIYQHSVATTECGHSYCIGCLLQIDRCALCRRLLLKSTLNQEIVAEVRKRSAAKKMAVISDGSGQTVTVNIHAPDPSVRFYNEWMTLFRQLMNEE